MMRISGLYKGVFSLLVLAALSVAACPRAQAQVIKPFKITGAGVSPTGLPLPGMPARMHWAIGEATHLGRYYGEGTVQTLSIDVFDLANGRIAGRFGSGQPFIFTGANGDQLACDYGDQGGGELGTYELTILGVTNSGGLIVKARFTAEFVPRTDLCTGKFAGVTGGWVMIARSAPFLLGSDDPVYYSWEGDGQLTFRKGK